MRYALLICYDGDMPACRSSCGVLHHYYSHRLTASSSSIYLDETKHKCQGHV